MSSFREADAASTQAEVDESATTHTVERACPKRQHRRRARIKVENGGTQVDSLRITRDRGKDSETLFPRFLRDPKAFIAERLGCLCITRNLFHRHIACM